MKQVSAVFLMLCVALLSTSALAASWQVPGDFSTIQAAVDSSLVLSGDRIMVSPGEHAGALVTKRVEIQGEGGAIINSGPAHPSGLIMGFRLLAGSDGATITNLTFKVDLAIMNGDAVNDVTVTQCNFENPIQAISNWRGNSWEITHNDITDLRTQNGGGIGILVGDYSAEPAVRDNVVSHNKIMGTLHVDPSDGGGYAGSGIVLYADFRWGRAGAKSIDNNRVVKNKVSLTSDNAGVVDVVAFELTDTRDDSSSMAITDNAVGFNDFRGTVNQIALTPVELGDVNDISRNLGENRGHGLPPSTFGPGGN